MISYNDSGPDTSVPAPARLTGSGGALDTTGSVPGESAIPGYDTRKVTSDLSKAASQKLGNDNYIRREFDSRMQENRGRMDQALQAETASANDPALTHPWNADRERADRIKGPLENFGSLGTIFALAASAFTRTPMTSALNAGAAAMTAMKDGDELGYKSAYQAWKDNTDLVQKRFNMERAVYDDATKLASTDLATARSKLQIAAAQFEDTKILTMLENGMDPQVFQTLEARTNSFDKWVKSKKDFEDLNLTSDIAKDKFAQWKSENPPPPPDAPKEQQLSYGLQMRVAEHKTLLDAKKQVYESQHPTYGVGGLNASKDQATRIVERTQQLIDSGEEKDPKAAHARAAGEVQAADSKSRSEGAKEGKKTEPTLNQDGVDLAANMLIKGNPAATTNVGRGAQGAANLDAIKNRASEILKEKGMSPEEAATFINNNTAAFMGDKSGARVMANRVATIEQNSHVALATADRVLETSKNVSRTKFSDLNEILLAAERRTGDPEVIRYGIAVNTFINNYARAVGGSNNSLTNSARNEAHDLLQKYWSQGQIEVAVDQMKKELSSELKGAREAMQGWTKAGVTPDNLTGTVREGKGGQKYKFKGTTQEQMSDKSMWEPI